MLTKKKTFTIKLTENQIRSLEMVFREAEDANSYQEDLEGDNTYEQYVKQIRKISDTVYKQLRKQGWV